MSDEALENEEESKDARVNIGDTLRSAREAKSMAIGEVARRLNLEEPVVQALEQDNYESLPELAYIRGYLLAYVRLMDLPTSILKSFDEENQANMPLLTTRHSVQSSCSKDGWVKCVSSGLVVLLVIVSVLWVLEQSFNVLDIQEVVIEQDYDVNPIEDNKADPVEVFSMENELNQLDASVDEVATDEGGISEAQPVTLPDSESAVQTEIEEASATDINKPDTEDAQEVQEVQEVQQSDQGPALTMKFSDTTWIRIDDDKGNRLEAGTYKKGDIINLSHNGPLHLIIGRTNNVELGYGGEAVDLSSYKSGKVARLVLGKSAE